MRDGENTRNNRTVRTVRRRRRRRRPRTFGEWVIFYIRSGRLGVLLMGVLIVVVLVFGVSFAWRVVASHLSHDETDEVASEDAFDEEVFVLEDEGVEEDWVEEVAASNYFAASGFTFHRTDESEELPEFLEDGTGSSVVSKNAVLVDLDTNEIVAERDADMVVVPASMTKVLTLLVAVEHIDDMDETVKITPEMLDYVYQHDCSVVGFEAGEKPTMRDLLYGTILPSGADAVLALCNAIAGSQDAFVELMNEKADELGLSGVAHFTNAIGLYDDDLHCTCADMAGIMKAALSDDTCREILDAHVYTTSKTKQHPDGITISNWFLRRIEDKYTPGRVAGAKTGYVDQSGACAVSYLVTDDDRHYVCVTTNSTTSWRCINDHVDIYNEYVKPGRDDGEEE